MNLVNKDQLEILSALRESVNEDKAEIEADMLKLQNQIKELSDKNKMQLEQINGLLLEKINLQSEGIGQREKMLERERNFRYPPPFFSKEGQTLIICIVTCVHLSMARMFQRTSKHACSNSTKRTSFSRSNYQPLKVN